MIEIWNPNSSDKFGIHYCLESGIHGDESRQSWIPLYETKKLNQFFFAYTLASVSSPHASLACEQALLFGRASRERASEGPRKGELATISHKFSFPPRKPWDSAKRENCLRKRAAD